MRCAVGCHRVTRRVGRSTYKGARSDVVCYGVAAIGEPSKQAVEGSSPFSRSLVTHESRPIQACLLAFTVDFFTFSSHLLWEVARSLVQGHTPWLSNIRRVRPSGDVIGRSVLRQALDHLSNSHALSVPFYGVTRH